MRHTDPTPGPALAAAPAGLAAVVLAAILAGCGASSAPSPAGAEAEATPAAESPASDEHTALRDAMQAPIDRAEEARAATEAADAERARALEDAGG
jgi:hypothetical protein